MLRRTIQRVRASTMQLGGGGINDYEQKALARKLATAFLRGDYGRTPSRTPSALPRWKAGRGQARGGDERGGEEGGEGEEGEEGGEEGKDGKEEKEGKEGKQQGGKESKRETVGGKKRKEKEEEKSGGEENEGKVVYVVDGLLEVEVDKRAAADEMVTRDVAMEVAREVAMEEGVELGVSIGVLSVRREDTSEFEMAV